MSRLSSVRRGRGRSRAAQLVARRRPLLRRRRLRRCPPPPRQGLADRFEQLAAWAAKHGELRPRVRRRPGRESPRCARPSATRSCYADLDRLRHLAGHRRATCRPLVRLGNRLAYEQLLEQMATRRSDRAGARRTGRAGDECRAGRVSRGARPRVARPPLALTSADSSPEGSRLPTSAATRVRRLAERQSHRPFGARADPGRGAGGPRRLRPRRKLRWSCRSPARGTGIGCCCTARPGPDCSRPARRVEPISAAITHVDGLVVARSTFDNSMNYRSAVVFGVPEVLAGADQARALDVLVDHLLPGRSQEVRPSTRKELAATRVLRLPLDRSA